MFECSADDLVDSDLQLSSVFCVPGECNTKLFRLKLKTISRLCIFKNELYTSYF